MIEKLIPNPIARYVSDDKQQSDVAARLGFVPDLESTMQGNHFNHSVSLLNILGAIPVVSTLSGAYRTLVGLAYLVKSVAARIFFPNNQEEYEEGIKIAAASIGRGVLEMIPIIGNIFVVNIDASRMMQRWADKGYAYADPRTIPVIREIDETFACLAIIPGVGTVSGAVRALFASAHFIVNLPPAIAGNEHSRFACGWSIAQIGVGIIEAIPVVGTLFAAFRGLNRMYYVADE